MVYAVAGVFWFGALIAAVGSVAVFAWTRRSRRHEAIYPRFARALGTSDRALAASGTHALFPVYLETEQVGLVRFGCERWTWVGTHWAYEGLSDFEPPLPFEFDATLTDGPEIEAAWEAYNQEVAHENQCLYDSRNAVRQLATKIVGTSQLAVT